MRNVVKIIKVNSLKTYDFIDCQLSNFIIIFIIPFVILLY